MTKKNTSSTLIDAPASTTENLQQADSKLRKNPNITTILGVFAIILVIASGAVGYLHICKEDQRFLSTNQVMQQQFDVLNQRLRQERSVLEDLLRERSERLDDVNRVQARLVLQLNELQEQVAILSGSDSKICLLAQVDFLVKMATQKLSSDQDVTTTVTLLNNADTCLADINDPSLVKLRRAIFEDINTLSNLTHVNFDDISLRVKELSNQVDKLDRMGNQPKEALMDQDKYVVSRSIGEWKQNLRKSWHNFIAGFITFRRHNATFEFLLSENQDIFLRENIRFRLLLVAQAIPRHQNDVYQQSLGIISTWVRAYFNTTAPDVQAFLEEVGKLSDQSIAMDLPNRLRSQLLLEKIMQTRRGNLISHYSIAPPGG
ncbi:Putative uroporphyrinogen-III C-methyltransferase [Serratia symbiotica]|nr:Putative uroporphyrinogen-III C-methyltransferase [Serratia symbiotica]